MPKKVVIVGGVAGGASAAARLRRLEEDTEIILLERGEHISFANCGLPYYIGGVIQERERLLLQTPQSFWQRFRVDVRTRQEVTAVDPLTHSVTVHDLEKDTTYQESYDKLLLSPGASPVVPPIPGVDSPHVFALRNIPDMDAIQGYIHLERPKHVVVLGGGAIGIEMAENLHHLGLNVTIVEMADHLINSLDAEMTCELTAHIQAKGVSVITKTGIAAIESNTVTLGNGNMLPADLVILAAGVRPDTQFLQSSPLHLNEKGAILVNQKMRTNMPDIYAVGDAVTVEHFIMGQSCYIPLAGPANKQGRIAADNIAGLQSIYTGTQGTSIMKCFDMTAASTGVTEATAKQMKLKYEKIYTFSPSHAGYYPGAQFLTIKLIFDTVFGRILGAQLVGYEGVDKRCDVLATAIRAGLTIHDLTELELAYAPPYSSAKDPVNMAGYVASNVAEGLVEIFHLDEISQIGIKQGFLLDVRTAAEFSRGAIPNAVNIPVDELREHLDELPKDRTIYIYCQIGLRGYIASRILTAQGFQVKNLSGGYRLYDLVKNTKTDKPNCGY